MKVSPKLLCVLLGAALLIGGIVQYGFGNRLMSNGVEVQATVVDVVTSALSNPMKKKSRAVVEFELDGETHRFKTKRLQSGNRYNGATGDTVRLVVDPAKPSAFTLAGTETTKASNSWIVMGLGAFILSLPLWGMGLVSQVFELD